MADSDIGWTTKVWNPTRGCRRISAGCGGAKGEGGCYAEKTAHRFSGRGQPYEGLVKLTANGPRWTGAGRFVPEKLAEPLRWRKPCRIFVDSMSDLFFEAFSNEEIAAVFGVMAACPQHTFQCLTKRPERMREWFAWVEDRIEVEAEEWSGRDCSTNIHTAREQCILEYLDETATAALAGHFDACHLGLTTNGKLTWPLPNVHLGISVEDQSALDERWPHLAACPAALRWFSAEPLLGPLDFTHVFADATCKVGKLWVVGGCESGGGGARPALQTWFESLADQCSAAAVPYFMKQLMVGGKLRHDLADFPPHLQIQEFPT